MLIVLLLLLSLVPKAASLKRVILSFVLFILANGCTNLIPPEDAWIKREDDKIIIGCYTSRQTWQLRCHDGRWTGVVSNCSSQAGEIRC